MSVIYLLLTLSLTVAIIFLILFIVAVKKGQFEDLDAPPLRLLFKSDSDKKTSN